MQLHQLKPIQKRKNKKRIGRGGKRGTYSGRGQKGQRARAGHRIRPAERDLIQRIPKLKGTKNKAVRSKPIVLNVGELEKRFGEAVIDKELLLKKRVIKKLTERVKILGRGDIKKVIQLKGLEVSRSAKEKIEKAGGTAQ